MTRKELIRRKTKQITNLARELKKIRNMNATVIISALDTVTKGQVKGLEKLDLFV